MKVIEKIRKMTAEVIDDLKWPLRLAAIKRAADSLIGKTEEERINTDQKIIDLHKKLTAIKDESEAKAIWKEIAIARIELEEIEHFSAIVKEEQEKLFADE